MRLLRDIRATKLSATGGAVDQIRNNNSSAIWKIEQISLITSPTASGCTCTVRPPTGIVDTSYFAGTGDVASGDPPIWLFAGEYIELTWASGPASGTGIATYFGWEIPLDEFDRVMVLG